MEFLKASTTHVVVMFDGERRKYKKLVDLVPRSWLTCYEENIIFCSYPPKEDYSRVDEWTKQMLDPNPGWKKDRVTVRKEAETALRKLLEEMEQRFMKKVEGLKRSILYDLKLKVDELKATVNFNHPVEIRNVTRNREILGFELPITTLEEFLRLDLEIKNEDKKGALKSLMEILAAGTESVSDNLVKIFSATIHKDVQLLYSAVGRKINGVGKRNFSETSFYQLLQDFLLSKHEKLTAPMVISKLSRFLSGANDRNNGRRNRGVAEPMQVAERQAAPETRPHAGLEVIQKNRPHTGPEPVLEARPHTNRGGVPEVEVGHRTGPEVVPETRPRTGLTASSEVGSQAALEVVREAGIGSSDDD